MKIPKDGSIWQGGEKKFRVIRTIELEGHMWIHYKEQINGDEYSCYVESFLSRFHEVPE
jgi:hypothetical protein